MPRQPSDPLSTLLARRRINGAQAEAGREFKRCVNAAKAGDRHNAGAVLLRCYDSLGTDGAAVVTDAVVRGVREIAQARGMAGEERYVAKRLYECLSCLAETLGFENKRVV